SGNVMHICWKIYLRSIWESLTSRSLTIWQKLQMLFGWCVLYPLGELFLALCLALDYVFFPAFRKVKVEAPVFVIGNPRSGTTHLFRLMAMDQARFTSLTFLEIIFPALVLRWFFDVLRKIDPSLGGFFQ